MAKVSPYRIVEVESYYPASTAGLHGLVHIRPVPGQGYSANLHVECAKSLSDPHTYAVGTRFKIRAKLTDRDGGGEYLYSYFGWAPEIVSKPKRPRT